MDLASNNLQGLICHKTQPTIHVNMYIHIHANTNQQTLRRRQETPTKTDAQTHTEFHKLTSRHIKIHDPT